MFKLIFKLICLAIAGLIAFVVISLHSGGDKFRWFGKKVEQESEKIGGKADELKNTGDKAAKGVEKAKEKIKDLTGK